MNNSLDNKRNAFWQFLYESETKAEETDHHQLLKDIQHGVKLRKVKTNDKSKPYIEGKRITNNIDII